MLIKKKNVFEIPGLCRFKARDIFHTASIVEPVMMSKEISRLNYEGYFADTLDQLSQKIQKKEYERLSIVLPESELYRYTTKGKMKTYVLFLPVHLVHFYHSK